MAENQDPPRPATADSHSVLARGFSNILSRSTTLTQEITETITFLTDSNAAVEALLDEEKQEEQELTPQLSTNNEAPSAKRKETPYEEAKRHEMNEKIGASLMDPERIMFWDKVVFFLGVVNVCLIAFWIGRSPTTYYHFWTFKCLTLFPLRWYSYKKRGWHYLMLELCYFGNFLGMYYLYFNPSSAFFRKIAYSYGAGPLMWSILAMRNSLVFHDFDKTTTLMMHASPAITAWTVRWYPDPQWTQNLSPAQVAAYNASSWTELLFIPVGCYFLWAILYYLTTFVLLKNRIQGRGRSTMFSIMVPKDPEAAKRSPLARMVLRAPQSIQPFVYLGCHGAAASLSFLPVKFFWERFWLHTAALAYCLGLAIWNGGNYYFKVFAKKYLAQLQEEAAKAKSA